MRWSLVYTLGSGVITVIVCLKVQTIQSGVFPVISAPNPLRPPAEPSANHPAYLADLARHSFWKPPESASPKFRVSVLLVLPHDLFPYQVDFLLV